MIISQELVFDKNQKLGDYDIIVIPYDDDRVLFERVGVCEVKIVRPTRNNPSKNANSMGITQVKGLIEDGFPFVGLIHVCMSEPLKDEDKMKINFCTIPANGGEDDDSPKIEEGKTLEDYFVPVKFDYFQWYSADKQMKRLISTEIPKYVSLECFGFGKNGDNFTIESCSLDLEPYKKGCFNPHQSEETIFKVRKHFEAFPDKYLKRDGHFF